MAELYDMKGNLYQKGPGSISFYKDSSGQLKRVPSLEDPLAKIITYVETCMKTSLGLNEYARKHLKEIEFGEATINYIQELWTRGEERTKKVLEMLERRAKELKGSVRALLYSKIREKLLKLQTPVFSKEQLTQLNIPRSILDDIDAVLKKVPLTEPTL